MSSTLMFCEACNADMVSGDLGTPTARGGHLCRSCTPSLSEVVFEYNVALNKGRSWAGYGFSSRSEMKARLADMVHELTTLGDSNIAVPL